AFPPPAVLPAGARTVRAPPSRGSPPTFTLAGRGGGDCDNCEPIAPHPASVDGSVRVAFRDRGAPTGLRSHPSNLIRVMPAKGAAACTACTDDRLIRLGRRCRDPG